MSTYQLEKVHSGRATCKKCKEKITKEEIRMGVIVTANDMEMKSYYHPKCFSIPKKFLSDFTTEQFLTEEVIDKDGILGDETIKGNIIEELDFVVPKKKKKSESSAEDDVTSAYISKIATRSAAHEEATTGDGEPSAKKIKIDEEDKTMSEINAYRYYHNMTNAELKDICRYNRVPSSGKKNDLLLRCIDGHVHGRLGLCDTCGKGKLKIGPDGNKILCSGYFDEVFYPCHAVLDLDQVKRYQPWFTSAPSEDDIKEMNEIFQTDEKEVDVSTAQLGADFTDKVKSIEWNVSTKEEIRETNKAFIDLLVSEESPFDCGTDPNKIKIDVGKILNENKDTGVDEFLKGLISKFGVKSSNMKQEENRAEKYASLCKVPANAAVYGLVLDFEKLHREQKQGFKANAYSKAAEAIKHLNFEITESNALSLGKPGKNKVPGIGKGISQNMEEFLRTGSCAELEELGA